MDAFKKAGSRFVGHGGMKCPCCAPAPGKDRKALRRRTRHAFKSAWQAEIRETLSRPVKPDFEVGS